MRKTFSIMFGLCFCFTLFAIENVNADAVYLTGGSSPNTNLSFIVGGSSYKYRSSPKTLEYQSEGPQSESETIFAFCGDFVANTHPGLSSGRYYNEDGLSDYSSENQMSAIASRETMIQNLYDYAYNKLFSLDTVTGTYDTDNINMFSAQAFQVVLWELLHETSTTLSFDTGYFKVTDWAPDQNDLSVKWDGTALKNEANLLLDCVTGVKDWTKEGFVYVQCDVSIFTDSDSTVKASDSQIMISGRIDNTTTPEPATLLIIALGATGVLPLSRRFRKK